MELENRSLAGRRQVNSMAFGASTARGFKQETRRSRAPSHSYVEEGGEHSAGANMYQELPAAPARCAGTQTLARVAEGGEPNASLPHPREPLPPRRAS